MSMRPSTYEWDGAGAGAGVPREGPIRASSQSRNVSFSVPHMPMSPLPSPMPLPLPIPSPVPDMWNYSAASASASASAPSSPVPFTMMDQRMASHQGMTMQQVNMQHQHPITGMPHLSYQEIQIYPHLTYEQQQHHHQHHEQHHHHSSQPPPHPIPMLYHSSSTSHHPQIQVEYVHDEHKPVPPTRNLPPRINPHTTPSSSSSSHPSPSSSNASTPKTSTSASHHNNKRKSTSTSTSTSTSNTSSPTPKRVRGRGKELELVDGQMVHLGQRRSRYARLLERMNAELMTCKLTLEQQKQRIQQLEEEKNKEFKQNQTDAWRRQHSRLTTAGLYDIMYMSSPFMIVIFDLNLRIMDANQAYLNEHGWTMDEIFGRRVPTVQMQIFAHPKFDTSKHPVNDLDVPPLKAGLPPDISASDLIVTTETFMAFKYVYEGRAPAARIRMAEIDARGRLGLMQVHSYLHYEKGADMLGLDNNNNNNNNIDGSSHDEHSPSVLSSPPASPAHVTSQMPIPYSRPTTPQDAYFLSLMSLKKPSFCPQRGQPMYFVSQCNIYERQILKTTPENDPASHAFAAFHEPASILHHLQQGTLSPTPLMMKSGGTSHSSRSRSPAPYMSSNVSTPSIASSAETPPSPLTWTADVPHSIQDYEHMYKQQVSEYIQNHPEAVNSRENTALFPVPLPHDAVPQVKHSIPSKYASPSPFGPPKDDLAWLQSDVTQ